MPPDCPTSSQASPASPQHIFPALPALLLVVGLTLAGCQTSTSTTSMPAVSPAVAGSAAAPANALSDAPGRVVAENRGWVVTAYPSSPRGRAYCSASRRDDGGQLLSFRATAERAALLVMANPSATPDRQATGQGAGELTARFSDGVEQRLKAMRTHDGGVIVPVELPTYDDLMEPFAESKTVTLEGNILDSPVGDISLGGSNWAINALAECRILHARG